MELTSWPGEARECVEIARFIQQEAASGVAFDRIAVFLRSTCRVRLASRRSVSTREHPAYFARGTSQAGRRGPSAAGVACVRIRRTVGAPLRRVHFARASAQPRASRGTNEDAGLRRNTTCFRRSKPKRSPKKRQLEDAPLPAETEDKQIVDGTLRAPWRWERLLVESSVIGSEERWERRIAGLERELRVRRDGTGRRRREPRPRGLIRTFATSVTCASSRCR